MTDWGHKEWRCFGRFGKDIGSHLTSEHGSVLTYLFRGSSTQTLFHSPRDSKSSIPTAGWQSRNPLDSRITDDSGVSHALARPIFVIGVQRSGTTWLANILCQHSKVCGVQAIRHHGIHESAFFSYILGRYEDLSEPNNFIEFLEAFSASDYFILSGLGKNTFYDKRAMDYPQFFRLLMDTYAKKNEADFWVEKSPDHSLYLGYMSENFPDAKFVAVKRGLIETIASAVKMHEDGRQSDNLRRVVLILSLVARYFLYYKHIESFSRKSNCILIVQYEDLLASRERILHELCRFLGLPFEDCLLEQKYSPNTSFRSNHERKHVFDPTQRFLMVLVSKLLRTIPFVLYKYLGHVYKRKRKAKLPDWFYSIMKEKLLSSGDKDEPITKLSHPHKHRRAERRNTLVD